MHGLLPWYCQLALPHNCFAVGGCWAVVGSRTVVEEWN